MSLKCQRCGNELRVNAKFCDNCGLPTQNVIMRPPKTKNQPKPKKEPMSVLSVIEITLVCVLGGITFNKLMCFYHEKGTILKRQNSHSEWGGYCYAVIFL